AIAAKAMRGHGTFPFKTSRAIWEMGNPAKAKPNDMNANEAAAVVARSPIEGGGRLRRSFIAFLPNVLGEPPEQLARDVRSTSRDSCGGWLWRLVRLRFFRHVNLNFVSS